MEIFYGDLYLTGLPEKDPLRHLAALRRLLALNISLTQLARQAQNLPLLLLSRYGGREFQRLISAHPEWKSYLQFQTKARYISSLWGWQKDKAPQPKPQPIDPAVFPRLAALIAGEGSPAAQTLAQCARQPADYFARHRDQYRQRNRPEPGPPEEICLLALADQLIEAGLVRELDWKEEPEEFLFSVRRLADRQNPGLPLDPAWFQISPEMEDWIDLLNENWAPYGFYLAQLAMDSDSFPLLCVSLDLLARLRQTAPSLFY